MRRSTASLLAIMLLSLTGFLVGCGGSETEPAQSTPTPEPAATALPFEGTIWSVTNYNSGDGALADSIEPVPTVRFIGGELTGTTGVNQYGGTYEVDGSSVKVTLGPTTLMAGTPEAMDQESAFLAALATVTSYEIEGEVLTLKTEAGETALVCTAAPQDLTQGTWLLVNYNNGKEAVVGVLQGTEITAQFAADGAVTGKGGCNTYNGTYEASGAEFKLTAPLASTKMMCAEPEGIMEQEAAFLAAFDKVTSFEIQSGQLIMYDEGRARQLQFIQQ